jgi:predicted RNA binding protein YcfA (HicA-like mRNA interferase family)
MFMLARWRSALGKLRILSGVEVCKILESDGFQEVRRRGSHVVMQQRTTDSTITIPVPDHKEIRIGTLQSIIRQSKLARYLFEAKS